MCLKRNSSSSFVPTKGLQHAHQAQNLCVAKDNGRRGEGFGTGGRIFRPVADGIERIPVRSSDRRGATSRRQLWLILPFTAVLALSLGGLPFTGGALAKLAVKETLGTGFVGSLSALSAIATTLLMARFL